MKGAEGVQDRQTKVQKSTGKFYDPPSRGSSHFTVRWSVRSVRGGSPSGRGTVFTNPSKEVHEICKRL